MPAPTKIKPILENDFDSIEHETVTGLAEQAKDQGMNIVEKQVIKPVSSQIPTHEDLMNYLYGPSTQENTPADPQASEAAAQTQSNSPSYEHGHIEADKQMSMQERQELSEEQKAQREKIRVHERNYYTFPTLDVLGTLEERVQQVRKQREQEEEQTLKEEEEKKQQEKEEEERKKQEAMDVMPKGKKTGMDPNALKREQNKTEQHRGQHG